MWDGGHKDPPGLATDPTTLAQADAELALRRAGGYMSGHMPDYAKQLDEIAKALSKPSLSPWLMTPELCTNWAVGRG